MKDDLEPKIAALRTSAEEKLIAAIERKVTPDFVARKIREAISSATAKPPALAATAGSSEALN